MYDPKGPRLKTVSKSNSSRDGIKSASIILFVFRTKASLRLKMQFQIGSFPNQREIVVFGSIDERIRCEAWQFPKKVVMDGRRCASIYEGRLTPDKYS